MKIPVERHAVQQPADESVKLIPLTKGLNAIVDAHNYDWLMQWNWIRPVGRPNSESVLRYSQSSYEDGKSNTHSLMHREIMGITPERAS